MNLSIPAAVPSRAMPMHEPTTMPMPTEPVAWRRWADAMPDICLWLDPHTGRIVDCNRALFGALGYSRTEVFGWPLQALAEPRNLLAAAATWRSLAACQALRDADCTLRARNGFEVAVSASASPVLNAEGKVVAGLVVLRDITERRKREQMLQARKRQLKSLAFELSEAEARERARIAQGLHDELGKALAHARLKLQQLAGSAVATGTAALADLDDLLARAQAGTQAASFELSCPLLQTMGLQAAIEHLAQRLTREGPLIARVEGEIPTDLAMPDTTRAVVFRVLRELANNARRHARARHLWFRIQPEAERLSIVVGDDGCGFDVGRLPTGAGAEGGCGLFAADAQMQAVGGRLLVQSRPGRGTRAAVLLPLVTSDPPETLL